MQQCIIKIISALALCFPAVQDANAENPPPAPQPRFMCTGSVQVGYTFHAGLSYGFQLGAGFTRFNISSESIFAGLSTSFHTFRYNDNRFKTVSLNSMLQSDSRINLSLGLARSWYKWGMAKRNTTSSRSLGLHYDINYMPLNNYHSPAIGYRAVYLMNHCMGFITKKARTVYGGYKYDLFL